MNAMIEAKRQDTAEGAILFDAAVLAQAGAFDAAWFEALRWQPLGVRGGRGGVRVADTPFGACVLRHYRRGGMVAALMGDHYLWTGEERTRGFAEFRLLAQLRALGLDVPAPIATSYSRQGMSYRADLITRRIDCAETFAEHLAAHRVDVETFERVGDTIAAFHAVGAYHADLNAHNILIDADKVWLIDFDRGRLRVPASAWRRENLARLLRSCRKVVDAAQAASIDSMWPALLRTYDSGFARRSGALRSVRT